MCLTLSVVLCVVVYRLVSVLSVVFSVFLVCMEGSLLTSSGFVTLWNSDSSFLGVAASSDSVAPTVEACVPIVLECVVST